MITMLLVGAWVIDRSWVSSACGEMVLATEAAAHAAALELIDDSRLTEAGEELRLRRARFAAVRVAAANRVAGSPVDIDETSEVLFSPAGEQTFDSDAIDPRIVSVTATRSAAHGDPLGLLLSAIGGTGYTDLAHTAIVRVENRLRGVAASETQPAPLLPLAVLRDGTDEVAGWNDSVLDGLGFDEYGYDDEGHFVTDSPDGLSEIVVVLGESPDANGLIASGQGFDREVIDRLVRTGHTDGDIIASDLSQFELAAEPTDALIDAIIESELIGRKRMLFLMVDGVVMDLAAGRVMAVEEDANGRRLLVIQPCVMSVSQGLVASPNAAATLPESNTSETDVKPNPYLFKLLTVH